MIDIEDIEIDDKNWRVTAAGSGYVTDHLLLRTINAIAREIQEKAKEFAPVGKGENAKDVPGTLRSQGILLNEAGIFESGGGDEGTFGEVVTGIHSFGGGFTVRGGSGRFTSVSKSRDPGHVFEGFIPLRTVVEASVELNPLVRHAQWVHEGTGIYGPHHHPIVPRVAPYLVFHWHGRRWQKKSVRGQTPQPFLTEAYEYVNQIYTPARVSELRAQLSTEL